MTNPSSTLRQRMLFRRFVVVSIVLHLLLVGGFFAWNQLQKMREQRSAVAAKEDARERSRKRQEQQAKIAELAKQQAAVRAADEAKAEIAAELHDQFNAVVGDQIKGQEADQIWADIMAQMTAGLDSYSRQAADDNADDGDLRQGMTDLQAKMLAELAAQLREKNRKVLADSFLVRVKSDVSPKLIEFYRKQLEQKIGNALRDEGQKIVREDAAEVRDRRKAAAGALADAARETNSALSDLKAAQKRMEIANKAADALRVGGKNDVADKKVKEAVHDAVAQVEHAGDAVERAGHKLHDAADKSDGLAPAAARAIRVAQDDIDRATRDIATATSDAKDGKSGDFAKSQPKAADTTSQLADAIKLAKDSIDQDKADPAIEARTAIKHARDEDLKQLIEKAFWENYGQRTAPRLGDKLTGAFKQTLEENGIKDDALVADVNKRVKDALINDVREKIAAGVAGTDPLSKNLKLDEIADAAGDPHAQGDNAADAHDGPHVRVPDGGGARDGAHAHGPDGGEAANGPHGNGQGERPANPHEAAVAQRIEKTARDLVHNGIEGIGDDAGGDDAAVKAAHGPVTGKHPHGDGDDDEGDGDGLAGLARRVGRLADNVKGGRTDLTDAALAGAGKAGGVGAAGAGLAGGGLGRPHLPGYRERYHGDLLRNRYHLTDEAEYAKLTADLKNRDPSAVRGQATTRRSAEGEIAAASANGDGPSTLRPASVLVPDDSKTEPIGQAKKSQPFTPKFKSIRFAAIPYRNKPVVIDGDLSEWADVPALAMTSSFELGHELPPGLKQFPQAVKVQWDNTGFYLAYDVKDADGKITKVKHGDFWEGDGVEFWVDTLNSKEKSRTQCTHQFWAWVDGAADDHSQVGGEAQSWPGKDDYVPLKADVMKTASKKTADGWTIEVFIPATRFRMLDLEPGRILGMNFSICTGTDLYYYWAGTTKVATARRPDTWGDVLLAGSAGRLECLDKLSPELPAGESAKPLNAVRIGQPLRVRVSDADMNLSNAVRDRIAVSVRSGRGQSQTLVLEETTNTSGVFEGSMKTMLDTGAAPSGVLPLLDGDQIAITYIDQCRPDGSRDVPVTLTLPTASAITKLTK